MTQVHYGEPVVFWVSVDWRETTGCVQRMAIDVVVLDPETKFLCIVWFYSLCRTTAFNIPLRLQTLSATALSL